MAICIDGNFVCLGGGCFCATPTGIEFSGVASGATLSDLRPVFQGETGFAVAPQNINALPLASGTPNTCVGSLAARTCRAGGASSDTHGYTIGGEFTTNIKKFPFSIGTPISSTIVGTRAGSGNGEFMGGANSRTHGYHLGSRVNQMGKFPFASDTNAALTGILTARRDDLGSNQAVAFNPGFGYATGGSNPGGILQTYDKFSFASDVNASCVGLTTVCRDLITHQSSTEHGYGTAGFPPATNVIQRFPFSADVNYSDVGNLAKAAYGVAGISGQTHGIAAGGASVPNPNSDTAKVERFPFSASTNATDVSELASGFVYGSGHQD